MTGPTGPGSAVTVDSQPSSSSANPLQNKALFPAPEVLDLTWVSVNANGEVTGLPPNMPENYEAYYDDMYDTVFIYMWKAVPRGGLHVLLTDQIVHDGAGDVSHFELFGFYFPRPENVSHRSSVTSDPLVITSPNIGESPSTVTDIAVSLDPWAPSPQYTFGDVPVDIYSKESKSRTTVFHDVNSVLNLKYDPSDHGYDYVPLATLSLRSVVAATADDFSSVGVARAEIVLGEGPGTWTLS